MGMEMIGARGKYTVTISTVYRYEMSTVPVLVHFEILIL